MPKYWGKQIFSPGRFPEVGQKQKTEKKKREERLKFGNNYGQLRIATPPQVAHAKLPGPISPHRTKYISIYPPIVILRTLSP